jgi:stage II sporulation protein D
MKILGILSQKSRQRIASHRLICILLTILIFLFVTHDAVHAVPIIKVGIFLDCKEINIKGDKGLKVFEVSTGENLLLQKNNNTVKIVAEKQGIRINSQSFKTNRGIKIMPVADGFLQVEGKKYRGNIEIISNKSLLKVINVIELEKYLYGVLKLEISPNWPVEALRTQAIAARTFALANMNKYIEQGFNLCATTNSQEYGGISCEHPATNKAVDDTRGIIATYNGKPINAVYHSDCGGSTENSEDVWGGYVPYLRSVYSDYEETVSPPNHQWDYSLSEQEIIAKLAQSGHHFNKIREMIIAEKTETGRVKSVEIWDDNNKKVTFKTNDFRLLVGPNLVRSSLFTMESIVGSRAEPVAQNNELQVPNPEQEDSQKKVSDILKGDRDFTISELLELLNRPKKMPEPKKSTKSKIIENSVDDTDLTVIFHGKGCGHGVGLSQWGAHGMAKLGFNYEEILKYYYKGIILTKLY